MPDYEQRYRRLCAAVKAYDNALRAYGLMGSAWVEHSDELDRLWAEVLDAAGLPAEARDVRPH